MLSDAFNDAGRSISAAMSQSIVPFKQANSLAQIFVNTLSQAIIKAITLKIVMGGLNFLGSFLGLPGFSSAANSLIPTPSGSYKSFLFGNNDVSSFRSFSGTFGLNTLSLPKVSISSTIKQIPVVLDTKLKGRDLFLTQSRQQSYRRKYYGSNN